MTPLRSSLLRMALLSLAITCAYAVNANADDKESKPAITIPNRTEKSLLLFGGDADECILRLLGKPQLGAKELLAYSHLVGTNDNVAFSEDLGYITQIKDYNRFSQGRLVMSTTKGGVVSVDLGKLDSNKDKSNKSATTVDTPPVRADFPFATPFAKILNLRTNLDGGGEQRHTLAATQQTIKIILRQSLAAELPNSQFSLASDFIGSSFVYNKEGKRVAEVEKVAAVFPSQVRIYDYKRQTILKEHKAHKNIAAGAVHPFTGRILILDGEDLVLMDEYGNRTLLAEIKGYVNAIVWGNNGSRFYIRQGSTLRFFDTSGASLSTVELGSQIQSMAWDASDTMVAISSPTETIVAQLNEGKVTTIGNKGAQWRRVVWSQDEGLLLTLGVGDGRNSEFWQMNAWDPVTGEKLPFEYEIPLLNDKEGYPFLAGVRGRIVEGSLRFYIFRQNGQYSDVRQAFVRKNMN